MESEILRFICSNQGAADTAELVSNLYPGQSCAVSEVIRNQGKFVVCGQTRVVARARLWVCRAKDCPGTCRGLHLCKNYLFSGSCQYTRQRRNCSFSHDLNSDHNQKILQAQELEKLTRPELCTLLMQSDNSLLPAICFDYNNDLCTSGEDCKRLHICEKYLTVDCICPKSHHFTDPQPSKVLQDRGVPDTSFRVLKSVYANKAAVRTADKIAGRLKGNQQSNADGGSAGANEGGKRKEWVRGRGRGGQGGNRGGRGAGGNQGNRPPLSRASSSGSDLFSDFFDLGGLGWERRRSVVDDCDARSDSGQGGKRGNRQNRRRGGGGGGSRGGSDQGPNGDEGANRRQRQKPVRDKTEICMYFIKGFCKHEERCFKAHDKMPYRWEVNEGDSWTALPGNEAIEKDYCDPHNSYSHSSSPPVHFDTMTRGAGKVRRLSTVNSVVQPDFIHTTEWLWYWQDESGAWKLYASDSGRHGAADITSATLEQKYVADDKDVVEFSAGAQSYSLSFQDMMQTNKHYGTRRVVCRRPRFVSAEEVRATKGRKPQLNAVPDHWDKAHIPATGFSRVTLQRTSSEYKEVIALFSKTMPGLDVKVERIQNKALWEAFQLHKKQMKDKNGGRDIAEKKLFHGTNSDCVKDICNDNIDWRICGTNGTVYGRGSYFARDAKYSHQYTGNGSLRTMFVCRVLVGEYTRGDSSYLRAPFKDSGKTHRYHSCVNDVTDPSIFVVFEMPKIYPEYLLQYSAAVAPKPAVVHRPAPVYTPAAVHRPAAVHTPAAVHRPAATATVHRSPSQPASSSHPLVSTPSSYQRVSSSYHSVPYSYSSSTSSYSSGSASISRQPVRISTPVTPKPAEQKKDTCVIA